ncbi:DNA polymerase III subunit delta' [bacterium]|nr:DNA polymerase III subunit delta' [bacterium]
MKQIIRSAVDKERLAHGYLFHGPPGVGKDLMAIRIAMELNCAEKVPEGCGQCGSCQQIQRLEHPSFRFVFPVPSRPKSMKPEKYNAFIREKLLERIENPYTGISFTPEISALPAIGIEQIRALKQEVILRQQGSRYRVFIVSHADQMTVQASNSLLKLLEEPPAGTLLILTTSVPNRLLPTIASRCQHIRFDSLSTSDIENALNRFWNHDEDNARFFARMSSGSLEQALALSDAHFEKCRSAAWTFLENSLHSNHLSRLDICDTLIQDLDKTGIQSMLNLLAVTLRDLYCIQIGIPEKIINLDREKVMTSFLDQYGDMDLNEAIACVEHAIASLKKNVYLNLIVHVLSQNLYDLGRKRLNVNH